MLVFQLHYQFYRPDLGFKELSLFEKYFYNESGVLSIIEKMEISYSNSSTGSELQCY